MTDTSLPVSNVGFLKSLLIVQAIIDLIYGISYLFTPETMIAMSQDPVGSNPAWFRWAGGTLLGLCVGMVMASRNVAGQGPIVTLAAVGNTLVCLALAYSWATEFNGATWFIASPVVITLVLAVLFWWARAKYSDIL